MGDAALGGANLLDRERAGNRGRLQSQRLASSLVLAASLFLPCFPALHQRVRPRLLPSILGAGLPRRLYFVSDG